MLKAKPHFWCHPAICLYLLLTILIFNFCTENQSYNRKVNDTQKPNIVLILTDDQGWSDLASYGNRVSYTPNLDTLGSEPASFLNFYVSPV